MMFLCRLAVSLALFVSAIAPLDAAPAPEPAAVAAAEPVTPVEGEVVE